MKKLKIPKFHIISKSKRKKRELYPILPTFRKGKTGICTTNPNSTETTTKTAWASTHHAKKNRTQVEAAHSMWIIEFKQVCFEELRNFLTHL